MNNLLENISAMFKKYGVKSVTMDDIAREFGISKKTLYQHFENKTDVVYKVAYFEFGKEREVLEKLCQEHKHVIDQLLVISKFIVKSNLLLSPSLMYSMEKYFHQTWEELINIRREFILNLIDENFKKGMNQGIYRSDINLSIIKLFYSLLLNVKSIEFFNDITRENFDDTFNTIFTYHIRGIANHEGIEYLEKRFLNGEK